MEKLSRSRTKARTMPVARPAVQQCKICLEPEDTNEMISPCRCVGSVEFVHEQCLKVWILGRKGGPQDASCELCQTSFTMYCRYTVQYSRDWIQSPQKSRLIIVPISLAIMLMLAGMIYVIYKSFDELPSRQAKIFSIALMSFCIVAASFVMVLVVLTVRRVCCVNKLTKWIIFNYERAEPGVSAILGSKGALSHGVSVDETASMIDPGQQFISDEPLERPEHLLQERKSEMPRVPLKPVRRSRSTENILQ